MKTTSRIFLRILLNSSENVFGGTLLAAYFQWESGICFSDIWKETCLVYI